MSEKVRKKREEKKLTMISEFMKVFCEQGLDGTYMRRLASSANVSEALLYRYFENKDDIIRQCTVLCHVEIQKELTKIIIESLSTPDQMAVNILDYVDSVIDTCRFLLQVMAHPTYCIMMEDTGRRVEDYIREAAKMFQKQLHLNKSAAVGAAFLLNSIINDYILKKSRENFFTQFQTIAILFLGE